jgi:hypothetical protein
MSESVMSESVTAASDTCPFVVMREKKCNDGDEWAGNECSGYRGERVVDIKKEEKENCPNDG